MPYSKSIISFVGKSVLNSKFSILIPTWNNFEVFKICIESIQKNSNFQHQIIVHVNEEKDETLYLKFKKYISFRFSRLCSFWVKIKR